MRYLIFTIVLFFSCSTPEKQEVNLLPKPQEIQINEGVFTLSNNTSIIYDSLFLNESKYLQSILKNSLKGSNNSIILEKI